MTVAPPDDNPHVFGPDRRTRPRPRLEDLDPGRLLYLEPHDLLGLAWEWEAFPSWHWDTLRRVREKAPDVSVHGEVFSPFSQLCEAVGVEETLVALRGDPGRVKAFLEALCAGTVELMAGHVAAGADAVLVSSAYAGGGLISTRHYREFVLPFEARVVWRLQGPLPGDARLHPHLRQDRRPPGAPRGDGHGRHRHPRPAAARRRGPGGGEAAGRGPPLPQGQRGPRGDGPPRHPGRRTRGRPPPHRDRRAGRRLRALDRLLGAPGRAARERDGAPLRRRRGRLARLRRPGEG